MAQEASPKKQQVLSARSFFGNDAPDSGAIVDAEPSSVECASSGATRSKLGFTSEGVPSGEDEKHDFTLEQIKDLIDQWLQQEADGVQFPVPFDIAWQIPGYRYRKNALNNVENNLIEGEDFSREYLPKLVKTPQGGRPKRPLVLSCDGFKQFCLLAQTEEGRQIRQYFIEAEKKWRLVQQTNPQLAQEIELQKLKNEALQLEAQKMTAENNLLQFRNTIVTTCPEPVQKKILGFDVIEKIEYRDRVINDQQVLRDGNTVTKTELCRRYGLFSKSGNPDYKELNRMLKSLELPESAYEDTYMIRENKELKREYLEQLDDLFNRSQQRSLFFGE